VGAHIDGHATERSRAESNDRPRPSPTGDEAADSGVGETGCETSQHALDHSLPSAVALSFGSGR